MLNYGRVGGYSIWEMQRINVGMSFILIIVGRPFQFQWSDKMVDKCSITADFGNVKLGPLWATLPTQFAL